MKTLYLLVVFSAVIVPCLFSFHPNIKFHKTFRAFFIAVSIVGIVFIVWDAIFTSLGVWNFNPRYVTGLYIYNLPVEEILFFIFIPFSCVFTYFCLDKFYNLSWNERAETAFCILLSLGLLVVGLIFFDRLYTSVTFISAAIVCIWLKFIAKVEWFGKAISVYGILLIPFFIVNGILTGTGPDEAVVRYNNAENLGIRLLTIPVEDIFYGLELILLNIFFYKTLQGTDGRDDTPIFISHYNPYMDKLLNSSQQETNILIAMRNGSEQAFEKIYRAYSPRLFGKLMQLVKSDVYAKEILQDVFLMVWEYRASIDPEKSFRSFLFQIAENKAFDFFRKTAGDKERESELVALSTANYTIVEEFKSSDENLKTL